MDDLKNLVKQTVFEYVGGGFNLKTFPMVNEDQHVYGVVVVDTPIRTLNAGIVVLVRLVGDYVVIEEDTTDHPIYEVFLKRGVPREQLIRTYAGESIPELAAV